MVMTREQFEKKLSRAGLYKTERGSHNAIILTLKVGKNLQDAERLASMWIEYHSALPVNSGRYFRHTVGSHRWGQMYVHIQPFSMPR